MKQKQLKVFVQEPKKKGDMPLIEIPPDIADYFLGDKNKMRMIIRFDNGYEFHRALMRNKDGFCYMVLGKTTLKEAKKNPGFEEQISLRVDTSEFGMPVPEEFEEVLRQDDEGRQQFMALKPGLKRSFLYYINTGKTVDTRITRSLRLIENLKNGFISAGKTDMTNRS